LTKLMRSAEAKNASNTIRVSCDDRAFDFICSGDLTFNEVQAEVARLMRCEPCKLILIASDVDLEMESKSLVSGSATFLSHASIHFRIMHVAHASDVEMEDV
jgi:hypothetical protein